MAPSPQQPPWFSHPLLFLSPQAGGFYMAFGTGSQNFPFSTKHCTPKHARKHSALSSTKLPGQFKATRLQRGRKSLQWRSWAPLLPHQPLPLTFPHHPTTLLLPQPSVWSHFPDGQGSGRRREPSARLSMSLAWFHFYLLLFFTTIYLFIPIFISFWTCPAVSSWVCWKCKQKKLHSNAAFHCMYTFPIQHSSSAPTPKLKLKKRHHHHCTSHLSPLPWCFFICAIYSCWKTNISRVLIAKFAPRKAGKRKKCK